MYTSIKLSKMMLNPLRINPRRVIFVRCRQQAFSVYTTISMYGHDSIRLPQGWGRGADTQTYDLLSGNQFKHCCRPIMIKFRVLFLWQGCFFSFGCAYFQAYLRSRLKSSVRQELVASGDKVFDNFFIRLPCQP